MDAMINRKRQDFFEALYKVGDKTTIQIVVVATSDYDGTGTRHESDPDHIMRDPTQGLQQSAQSPGVCMRPHTSITALENLLDER
jgi:hypothetical protein